MAEVNKKKKIGDFFIKTLNGMACGLFATLIIGTILGTLGKLFGYNDNSFCNFMTEIFGTGSSGISYVLQILTGAGIGVGVALALEFNPLKTIVLAGVGETAAYFSLSTNFITLSSHPSTGALKVGDPLTIYLVCIAVAILIKLILKEKTPVDLIIVPLLGSILGLIFSLLIRYPAIYVTYAIQWAVNAGTNAVPFVMGIVVAVIMGMALTAPISSAAIAAMIFILPEGISIEAALEMEEYSGLVLASGAAIVGCSCQMIGFAVQSRHDNNIGTVISIAIGTSMWQFKNILRKPIIWLPTIIASAILGPISTCFVHVVCMGSSAGMGTAGLVGQIGTFTSMGSSFSSWFGIFGLQIIFPMIIVFGLDLLFMKLGWYKKGDMKI